MSKELFDLTGKVALVTGATRGPGMAMRLGEAGATLVVNGHCSDEKIIAAIKKYQANGITTHGYRFDVTVETAVEAVVANI